MKSHKLPPEFQNLTPDQLEEINDLLREKTYKQVQEDLWCLLHIRISINKLFRYYQKLQFADNLSTTKDAAVHVDDLLNLFNGKPVHWDKAGIQAIKKRALELVVDPNTKPSLLKDLFRIFTYEERQELNQRRVALAERKQKFAEDCHARAEEKDRVATEEEQQRVLRGIFSGELPLFPHREVASTLPSAPHAPQPDDNPFSHDDTTHPK